MATNIKFVDLTRAEFNALESKNAYWIYWLSDEHTIYKGDDLFGTSASSVKLVDTITFDEAEEGVIYVLISDEGEASLVVKGAEELIYINESMTKDEIEQYVTDSIKSSMEENTVVTDVIVVEQEDGSGVYVQVTDATGAVNKYPIADLFLSSATYDKDTHVVTLTVSTTSFELDLSDLFVSAMTSDNVIISNDIILTMDIGGYSKGDVISADDSVSLQTLLTNILSNDIAPEVVAPSLKVTLSDETAMEVGTSRQIEYTVEFDEGSYSDNFDGEQATGVTTSSLTITDTYGDSSDLTGSVSPVTQTISVVAKDDTDYQITANASYTDGVVPTTYLGEEYPDGQITADTIEATSPVISVYRAGFFGCLESKDDEITSDIIRSLTSTEQKVEREQEYTIPIDAGTQRIIFAIPATVGEITSITSAEQGNIEIVNSFDVEEVNVVDASGTNAIAYTVYVKDFAGSQEYDTHYTVTI